MYVKPFHFFAEWIQTADTFHFGKGSICRSMHGTFCHLCISFLFLPTNFTLILQFSINFPKAKGLFITLWGKVKFVKMLQNLPTTPPLLFYRKNNISLHSVIGNGCKKRNFWELCVTQGFATTLITSNEHLCNEHTMCLYHSWKLFHARSNVCGM